MIIDNYKQGFGSISRLLSKRSSRNSLSDNRNQIHFQCCNSEIINVSAHKTSQNSIYRHLWLSCALINHPARPKIIDAPLMLILPQAYPHYATSYFGIEYQVQCFDSRSICFMYVFIITTLFFNRTYKYIL
jgi:hypothetical protein